MAQKYVQSVSSSKTRFTNAPMGELEFSTLLSNPTHLTSFSAGDIVPIYCNEVLPHDTFDMDIDFVIRQATVAVPTMGQLNVDFYAFFVPNRVVNKSWKETMGENSAGAWAVSEDIVLAPLATPQASWSSYQVPIGSVADYYGLPTQRPLAKELLSQMHDLKFRGYIEIYNQFFRDQNYQPPVPYSKLNVYEGFTASRAGVSLSLSGDLGNSNLIPDGQEANGQYGAGAFVKAVYGDGGKVELDGALPPRVNGRKSSFLISDKPFKANKLHDYFTSVLPSPQRGQKVYVSSPLNGFAPLDTSSLLTNFTGSNGLMFAFNKSMANGTAGLQLVRSTSSSSYSTGVVTKTTGTETLDNTADGGVVATNLVANLGAGNIETSIALEDIRMSAALQQYYEILGRGGGRYREFINSFFGLDIDNPFDDIPTCLGHFRRELDLFQTAQTSASPSSSSAGTPQGNLSAFGYTNKGGKMFTYTFKEHGYLHVFAVVRHRNVYSSMISRDNFRRSALDFYTYPLANISEQPVYTREINPFLPVDKLDNVFGYNEAWAEYRMEPDRVSGQMRPQTQASLQAKSLSYWNYSDDVDVSLETATGDWLISNTEEVVARSTAVQDEDFPQFKGQFIFHIKKERPMPTYSVAGMDII